MNGVNLTFEIENGLAHTISDKEWEFVRLWLEEKLAYTKIKDIEI